MKAETSQLRKGLQRAALGALGLIAVAPVQGVKPSLAMLDRIEPGSWEIRPRETGDPSERICLTNGRLLIQLRHPEAQCDRLILQDTPQEVLVQYTCPGRGYGRTRIRLETSRLVQIDSQGIAKGFPFEFSAEARRVGDCAGGRTIATARANR